MAFRDDRACQHFAASVLSAGADDGARDRGRRPTLFRRGGLRSTLRRDAHRLPEPGSSPLLLPGPEAPIGAGATTCAAVVPRITDESRRRTLPAAWGLITVMLLLACSDAQHGEPITAPVTPAATPVPTPTATPVPAPTPTPATVPATAYVGTARCADCHAAETAAWRGSHHDRAMEVPSPESVLGNFDDARFEHFGVTSRFFRRDGRYLVETEGADGEPAEFEVAWTFGVDPLQQFLVRFPRGHVQALGIAWDARPAAAGGQRWLSLHPEERVPPDDILHWTAPSQRWNTQCADCHSTALRRGYDLERDAYRTTWAEIDVACEACHGPGAAHAAWAEAAARGEPSAPGSGAVRALPVHFPPVRAQDWGFDAGAPIARLRSPRPERAELDTCAPCHSRRTPLRAAPQPGDPFLDGYRPALLEAGLYEADGQPLDEVFVYGSFVQSRMHAVGVTCRDCHDPHSLQLRAEGNGVCAQCHRSDVFDVPAHHRHAPDSAGARCVSCHMPARTYMVVDLRRDHSFRVPRPDLSVAIGTPNACNDCHRDQSAEWAADTVARWYPNGRRHAPHFATALAAGRRGGLGADRKLAALAADPASPPIARATALSLIARPETDTLLRAAADPEPLVRLGALEVARRIEPAARLAAVQPLLRDPLRAVRIEAARVLADVPVSLWRAPDRLADRTALAEGLAEYRAAQHAQADRPESHVNLALLHLALGEREEARRAYETALRLSPEFVPAVVNLADLDRSEGREDAAEVRLRSALETAPDSAALHHALGLTLIRTGRRGEALVELERASTLAPEDPRLAYVLGIALHDTGETDRALEVLHAAHQTRPNDRDVLLSLALLSREAGRPEQARQFIRTFVDAFPDAPESAALRPRR